MPLAVADDGLMIWVVGASGHKQKRRKNKVQLISKGHDENGGIGSAYARFSTVADAAGGAAAVQQRLTRSDIPVACAIQAHLLLHRFHLIARRIDEVPPAGQLGAVDLELVRILLDNRCWSDGGRLVLGGELREIYLGSCGSMGKRLRCPQCNGNWGWGWWVGAKRNQRVTVDIMHDGHTLDALTLTSTVSTQIRNITTDYNGPSACTTCDSRPQHAVVLSHTHTQMHAHKHTYTHKTAERTYRTKNQ